MFCSTLPHLAVGAIQIPISYLFLTSLTFNFPIPNSPIGLSFEEHSSKTFVLRTFLPSLTFNFPIPNSPIGHSFEENKNDKQNENENDFFSYPFLPFLPLSYLFFPSLTFSLTSQLQNPLPILHPIIHLYIFKQIQLRN